MQGQIPYRGEINDEAIVKFIKGFFAGSKGYDDLQFKMEKVYDSPQDWLVAVKNWESFKYLRGVTNFAGDLILKYFPDEIRRES